MKTLQSREAWFFHLLVKPRDHRTIHYRVDIEHGKRKKLFTTIAKRPIGTLVAVDEAKRNRIDHLDGVAGLIDQVAKQLQRLLRASPFSDVAYKPFKVFRRPVRALNSMRVYLSPEG